MCDTLDMTGNDLLRRLRRLAKRKRLTFLHEGRPGKGGHGRIYLGERFTRVTAQIAGSGDVVCERPPEQV
jgi:hypothetical protein